MTNLSPFPTSPVPFVNDPSFAFHAETPLTSHPLTSNPLTSILNQAMEVLRDGDHLAGQDVTAKEAELEVVTIIG